MSGSTFTHGDAMDADRDTLYREWVNMLNENVRLRRDLESAHADVRRVSIVKTWSDFFASVLIGLAIIGSVFAGVGAAAVAILGSLSLFGVI